jgi:hypothetical protein
MKNSIIKSFILTGCLLIVVEADFIRDNDKKVVLDSSSGLIWQDDGVPNYDWQGAINYCENLTLGGYEDWRLPNYNELYNLADRTKSTRAISAEFQNVEDTGNYWTSTSYFDDKTKAWQIYFGNGNDLKSAKSSGLKIRCVRDDI